MYKKVLASVIALSVFAASMPAEAAFGRSSSTSSSSSRSYSSSSSSRSYSSPSMSSSRSSSYSSPSSTSSSYSSPSSTSSNKSLSGGTSLGMSRSSVTQSVRDGSYKQTMPSNNTTVAGSNPGGSYSNSGSYSNGSSYSRSYSTPSYGNTYNPPVVVNQGHSTGALVGAAVAGGLVGYMLHRDNSGNVYYTNPSQPGIAYGANGQQLGGVPNGNYQSVGVVGNDGQVAQMAAPVVMQQAPAHSGIGWFWWLVIIAAVLTGLYFIFRQKKIEENPNVNFKMFKNPEEKIRDEKDNFFINFQKNNRPSQIGFIQSKSDPVFFEAVKDLVMQSSDSKNVSVKRLESELVDITQEGTTYIASVRYQAVVAEDGQNTDIDEVWHFKFLNNDWKLAGIEQVNE